MNIKSLAPRCIIKADQREDTKSAISRAAQAIVNDVSITPEICLVEHSLIASVS